MDLLKNDIQEQTAKEVEKAVEAQINAVPYKPLSELPSMGTVVPLNLAGETLQAQYELFDEVGSIDNYLVEKLKYSSRYALSEAFKAEQADAIAMAIYQIEKKNMGFILADMAGIGKGRVNAAILRYAYVNGYVPVFITEKPNLFSAMYRDLFDIGGIMPKKKNKKGQDVIDAGYPLILNGFKSRATEKIYDPSTGEFTKISKPSETSIVDADGKEIIEAPQKQDIDKIVKGSSLPKQYDLIMMTYSQVSGKKAGDYNDKAKFLLRLAEKNKVILCMDECHNASGTTSQTGKLMKDLMPLIQGVLFSSATFSKKPDNMYLYSLKTNVMTSPISTDKLIEVIKAGGERLIETLAANLVQSGQMIRRERTYDNCTVLYNFMTDADKDELFEKYDHTIKLYRKIIDFFKQDYFINARLNGIKRFAVESGVKLCLTPKPSKAEEKLEWERENKGKYTVRTSIGDITKSQFNFIETLLFALKAEFVANQAIEQLSKQTENIKVKDNELFMSNRKPVIAVRNTLEGVYGHLGITVGDYIAKNDFSLFLESFLIQGRRGNVSLVEITTGKDDTPNKIVDEIVITDDDFEDGGQQYKDIVTEINSIQLNIPLSPIDHVIDKIQSTVRQSWDNYGDGSPTYQVGEVTGRQFSLKKVMDGEQARYMLVQNTKDKNKSVTFKGFNSGKFDCLLINESGSTGEDAHSSEKFIDQRPRVMIIHQVELDVNTEVQKRGRINRTGMVNYPTYVYAVSRIPSEIRRLLMLTKKLRKLDANTTANQKQSAKLSALRDSNGREIEDVINQYGDEVLDEFINLTSNESYKVYMPSEEEYNPSADFQIEIFVRKLELALSYEQEYFYNTINELYIQKKGEKGFLDLETNIVDLKTSIKNRILKSKGNNTNPFDSSVFIEDDYAFAEDKPYSKEAVEDLTLQLSNGKDPEQFYMDFLEDYRNWFDGHLKEVAAEVPVPDYSKAKDDGQRMEMEATYNLKVKAAVESASGEFSEIYEILTSDYNNEGYFMTDDRGNRVKNPRWNGNIVLRPSRPVKIPAIVEECYETNEDGGSSVTSTNLGRFVGIKLLNTAKEKYSPMNIELVFCQLSGKGRVTFKPTMRGRKVLAEILVKTTTTPPSLWAIESVRIKDWVSDPNRRDETTKVRLLTGNILSAYSIAKDMVSPDNSPYSKIIRFLKFTTAENSIRYGIKLTGKKILPDLEPYDVPKTYNLNNPTLIDDLLSSKYEVEGYNIYGKKGTTDFTIEYNEYTKELLVSIFGGLMKGKPKQWSENLLFFSPLFQDSSFESFCNQQGIILRQQDYYSFRTQEGSYKNVRRKFIRAKLSDEQSKEKIVNLFKFIYDVQPFDLYLNIRGERELVNQEDTFNPDNQLEEGEEGQYGYNTLIAYSFLSEKISKMPHFDKYVQSEEYPEYGTAYFTRRLRVNEVAAMQMIPLNSSLVDMVHDTFSIITDDDVKIKLKDSIKVMIDAGISDDDLGYAITKQLKGRVYSIQSIYGYNGKYYDFIGKLFKAYAKGDVKLPESEKKQQELEEQYEMEKKPLNMENAETFLILLTDTIKKMK